MVAKLIEIIKENRVLKESGILYISEGIGLLFAFFVVLFKSKFLDVNDVGLINYIVSIIAISSAFFNFGLDNTSARVVLNEKDLFQKNKIIGTALFLSILLAAFYTLCIVLFFSIFPQWGKVNVREYLYLIAPCAGYSIILLTYKQVCFAHGAIKEASVQLFLNYALVFLFIVISNQLNLFNVSSALFGTFTINMLTLLIPIVLIYRKYFRIDLRSFNLIREEQKKRGWKIYFSRVFFSSTFNLDTLILGYFHPLDSVAFYSITKYISMPVSMIGNSVSQSTYRSFVGSNKINPQIIRRVFVFTLLAAIFMLAVGCLFVAFLGKTYRPMLTILPLSLIYSIANGVNALYNSYMNAKGMANELRTLAFISCIANLVFNFALIIPFGAIGGVFASIIVIFIILFFRIHYCRLYGKNILKS